MAFNTRNMLSTFITHEKEFTAIASELQKIQESLANISKQFESFKGTEEKNQIRREAAYAQILEREMITQDKYDEMIEMLRTVAKQKGFNV